MKMGPLLHLFLLHMASLASADSQSHTSDIIVRDVAVIGGGAAGAHAAVWLRDHNLSVVVVEKDDHLGGHTYYYVDPATNKTINVGVEAWMQYEDACEFPARMNVSTSGSMQFAANVPHYIDFATGKPVANYTQPAMADEGAALQTFLGVLQKYQDYLLPGYSKFPAGAAIPDDLLMPFVSLVEKYGVRNAVPQMWDATALGLGDTMSVPAMWVMQASTNPMVEALLGTARAATPASGRLWDLFQAVQDFLGADVLFSTTVTMTRRDDNGVTLVTTSASGKVTTIQAKKLLIACQPTLENLAPFDTDKAEDGVFAHYNFSTVYAGILHHPSLLPNNSYSSRSTAAGSLNYTVFPVYPQVGSIAYIAGTENLFQFTAVGTETDTPESIKALIVKTIDNMITAGTLAPSNETVTFSIFRDHGLMHPRLSESSLRANVLQKQVALQGHRSTWYTGAAFSAPFSTILWEYNKAVLPGLVASL